jgi:hypothetical protein
VPATSAVSIGKTEQLWHKYELVVLVHARNQQGEEDEAGRS